MQDKSLNNNFLVLSAHDYRTARWASIHFTVEQLAKQGKTRFFSMRYSLLSKWRPDSRHSMERNANKIESYKGVDCYLWKTLVHPFNFRIHFLESLEAYLYRLYVWFSPRVLRQWIREADTIIIESGTALVFYPLIKKLNPRARIIYLCSDPLRTINCSRYVRDTLWRYSAAFDVCLVRSRHMLENFAPESKIYFVPCGMDTSLNALTFVSPYSKGIHAVSVGSMLFDASFFEIAGNAFPDITFHVIGCGIKRPNSWPNNVRIYDEMKFTDTLPFIKHADFGIAPYVNRAMPRSLADTSLKLMQYACFGKPAVCPLDVVGDYPFRFGYRTNDVQSISVAIKNALRGEPVENIVRPLNWEQVTDRVLNPLAYSDTVEKMPYLNQQCVRDQEILISLIISTMGRTKQLEALFQSLAHQKYKNFEVIVVDQNMDDRLLPITNAARWPFSLLRISAAGQKGLSRGRNLGLTRAKGDIVLFPDDDCWYPDDFLKNGANMLATRGCASLSGRAVDEKTLRSINGTFQNDPTWVNRRNVWTTQIEWVVFFKREALEAVGGYDEDIGIGSAKPWQACEGQDITLRLLEAGFMSFYDPSLYGFHAEHDISTPSEVLIAKGRGYARGLGHVLRRHHYGFLDIAYWVGRPLMGTLVFFVKRNRARCKNSINVFLGRVEGLIGKVF